MPQHHSLFWAVLKERVMSIKFITATLALATLALSSSPVLARGCLKGAAVGAVAGHFAHHHGMAGAAAGCAVGHHYAHHPMHMHRMHRI
jgi:hypothetical protein